MAENWEKELATELTKGASEFEALAGVKSVALEALEDLLQALIPVRRCRSTAVCEELVKSAHVNLHSALLQLKFSTDSAEHISSKVFSKLIELQDAIIKDAQAILEGDPAAKTVEEVMLIYPGFYAAAVYRIAHAIFLLDVPLIPRIFSEHAHIVTGIDIHPGAKIGESFCIDHGTGIVIGETTIIGNRVKLYQGVTLGALSVQKKFASKKRHPTIEDDVVIYAHASILGGQTVIGRESIVGGNVWLTSSIPPKSVVQNEVKNTVKTLSPET